MILTVEEYQKYLPNTDEYFKEEKMEAFELRALYKHFPKYIGTALVNNIASEDTDDDLLEEAKPAIACLSIFESVPFLDLIGTNNGFAIVSNTNLSPASRERVNALKEGCLDAANAYFDKLLEFLEENEETYSDWNKSCLNEGSLIPSVSEFIAATKIHVTRQAFVDMIPVINAIENTAFKKELSAEFLAELQEGNDTSVKPNLIISLAWATLAEIENDKPDKNSELVSKYSRWSGDFFTRAMAYIVNNIDSYETYSTYGYEAPYDNETDGEESGFFIMGAPR